MDTREKIVTFDSIRYSSDKTKVVIGYFDPLYAANVSRLRKLGRVIVIVADRPNAILPLRARAELVASLQCVENVVICDGDPMNLADIIDHRDADERSAVELSAHIVERYK